MNLPSIFHEPCPCDGCEHEARCNDNRACEAFSRFTQGLHGGERKPTRHIYRAVFKRMSIANEFSNERVTEKQWQRREEKRKRTMRKNIRAKAAAAIAAIKEKRSAVGAAS